MNNYLLRTKALHSLYPDAQWNWPPNQEIQWLANVPDPLPTLEQIDAEVTRLQAEYEATEYQRKRAEAYPSFADQFDLLYHGGYDAWKAAIDEIKTQYPKV